MHAHRELLTNLFLANPVDLGGQMLLAGHLLQHGAYDGAARIYGITWRSMEQQGCSPDPDLAVELTLAQ